MRTLLNKIKNQTTKIFDKMFNLQENKQMTNYHHNSMLINDLYDGISKDKEYSEDLETDIKRLESLRTVHEESAQIFNKIKQLRDNQDSIITNLKEDEIAVEHVKASFKENMDIMKDNLANIRSRIEKLKN
jgi:hypothetical protein